MKEFNKRLTTLELISFFQSITILMLLLLLLFFGSSCSELNPISEDFIGNKALGPFKSDCEYAEIVSVEPFKTGCVYTLSNGIKYDVVQCTLDVGDTVAFNCK